MTQEEILKGNKLIAEFMGWKYHDESANHGMRDNTWEYKPWYFHHELLFHSDWNWLMSVVEKIESLDYWFNIKKNHVTICRDNQGSYDSKIIHSEFGDYSKIERVYLCVIYFIKFCNQKQNT